MSGSKRSTIPRFFGADLRPASKSHPAPERRSSGVSLSPIMDAISRHGTARVSGKRSSLRNRRCCATAPSDPHCGYKKKGRWFKLPGPQRKWSAVSAIYIPAQVGGFCAGSSCGEFIEAGAGDGGPRRSETCWLGADVPEYLVTGRPKKSPADEAKPEPPKTIEGSEFPTKFRRPPRRRAAQMPSIGTPATRLAGELILFAADFWNWVMYPMVNVTLGKNGNKKTWGFIALTRLRPPPRPAVRVSNARTKNRTCALVLCFFSSFFLFSPLLFFLISFLSSSLCFFLSAPQFPKAGDGLVPSLRIRILRPSPRCAPRANPTSKGEHRMLLARPLRYGRRNRRLLDGPPSTTETLQQTR